MDEPILLDDKEAESLSSLLSDFGQEDAAKHVLKLMKQQHKAILKLCNDKDSVEVVSDVVCQHIAELGLKEILDTIKSLPISSQHYFAGSVLVAIKDIYVVKKYLWKDHEFIPAMSRLLDFSRSSISPMFRDIVACVIQGCLLGGTPVCFYESIASSNIIELFANMFENRLEVCFTNSYEELMMSLMLLCQNNKMCVSKCNSLMIPEVLEKFSTWEKIDNDTREKALVASACIEHMGNQESLPDHRKVLLSKFSEHIGKKNKKCKRLETIVCSNIECGRVEPDSVDGRFKKCARCHVALYCSKLCQKAHWKNGHSKVCLAPT